MQNAAIPGHNHPGLPPPPLVKMPSERLIRAVLATIDAWVSALDIIYSEAAPINRARVLNLKCQMLISKVSFIRLVNGTQEEIDAAYAQAKQSTDRPADDR